MLAPLRVALSVVSGRLSIDPENREPTTDNARRSSARIHDPMDVSLNPEPKWSKVDHLFVVLAENDKSPKNLGKSIQKLIDGSGFKGNSDETITLLADEPRKVTLMGLGKRDAITLRLVRTALYAIGKLARKQRDHSIAVSLPYPIADVGVIADFLSQSDYKYDSFITTKKEG